MFVRPTDEASPLIFSLRLCVSVAKSSHTPQEVYQNSSSNPLAPLQSSSPPYRSSPTIVDSRSQAESSPSDHPHPHLGTASGKCILRKSPHQLDSADHSRAVVVGWHGVTGIRLHKERARFGVGSALRMEDCGSNFESLLGVGDKFAVDNLMNFFRAEVYRGYYLAGRIPNHVRNI